MKQSLLLFLVSTVVLTGCAATDTERATSVPAADEMASVVSVAPTASPEAEAVGLEALAAQKLADYMPERGKGVVFQAPNGAWYIAAEKEKIESADLAKELFPEASFPERIGDFSFEGFYPYDTGFSGDLCNSIELYRDTLPTEGTVDLLEPSDSFYYGVRYTDPNGSLLILSICPDRPLSGWENIAPTDIDGYSFYLRDDNVEGTAGLAMPDGGTIWLSSLFPLTNTPYQENDARNALPQDEIVDLLKDAAQFYEVGISES